MFGRARAYTNVLLSSLLVAVLLVGGGPIGNTWAAFNASQPDALNVLATAKQFTISDLAAVARPGGGIALSWSASSWASGGYSVRQSATGIAGSFSPIGTTGVSLTTYADPAANGSTWFYQVYGLSTVGGVGTGSNVVSATADATSPTVSSTSPAEASTSNLLFTQVLVTFSKPMNQQLTGARFALVACPNSTCSSGTTPVGGSQTWPSANRLSFYPSLGLNANTWYGIQLDTDAADLTGNPLSLANCPRPLVGSTCSWSFQTGTSTAANGVSGAAPPDGSVAVPQNTGVSFEYTNGLSGTGKTSAQNGFTLQQQNGAGSPCYVYGSTPTCAASGGTLTWTAANTGSTFTPTSPLLSNTLYAVALVWNDSTSLVENYTATWTTGSGSDTTPPTVLQVVPAANATGLSSTTQVEVQFSEAMDVRLTTAALSLQPWATLGTCTGGLGAATSGGVSWNGSSTTITYTPSTALVLNTCYRLTISTSAADAAANVLAAAFTSDFTVLNSAAPVVTLSSSSVYYPGAVVTADGTGWIAAGAHVIPSWDDGSVLDMVGPAVPGGSFTNYSFSLPNTASSGGHHLSFAQAGGGVVRVPIAVGAPTRISLSTPLSDVSPGSAPVITATVFDGGKPAANTWVTFTISIDGTSHGSLAAAPAFPSRTLSVGSVTDGAGVATATLYTWSSGTFTPISVSAASGAASASLTIIDPLPLAPSSLHLSATDRLRLAWAPSPTTSVTGYRLYLGPATHSYVQEFDAGPLTAYTVSAVQAGQTYYAVARAYDAHGALSDPSAEVSITMPSLTATRLRLSTSSPAADGQTVRLTASVLDQYGRALAAAPVAFSAPTGATASPTGGVTGADGSLTVDIARIDPRLASARVYVTSGVANASMDVTFGIPSPVPSPTASTSPTPTVLVTATSVETATVLPGPTILRTPTVSGTATTTASPTLTAAATVEPSATLTATPVVTASPTPDDAVAAATQPGVAPTPTEMATATLVAPTATLVPPTPRLAPVATLVVPTETATSTPVVLVPTATSTQSVPSPTTTASPTPAPTNTLTLTAIPTPSPLGVGAHEDDDVGITYSAGWTSVVQAGASGGSCHAASVYAAAGFRVDARAGSLVVWFVRTGSGVTLDILQDGVRTGTSPEADPSGRIAVQLTGQGDRTIRLEGTTSGQAAVTFDRVDVVALPEPTVTLTPLATATGTPAVAATASATAVGTLGLTATPSPTSAPGGTPLPATVTPAPVSTMTPISTATAAPPDATPAPAATPTPTPVPATALPTPVATRTSPATAVPPATPVPPTAVAATPTRSPTPTP